MLYGVTERQKLAPYQRNLVVLTPMEGTTRFSLPKEADILQAVGLISTYFYGLLEDERLINHFRTFNRATVIKAAFIRQARPPPPPPASESLRSHLRHQQY